VARVLAYVPDLLFGSHVQGMLSAAGHEVELIATEPRLRQSLHEVPPAKGTVLVMDLTDADVHAAALLESLTAEGALRGASTLGFFSHVDAAARARAQRAGFDRLVPRSRMAREGGELVASLAGG
jgi:DNA-binding NarL/FixJ family response regulator